MKLLRYENNPMLEPASHKKCDMGAVFNCGVTVTVEGNIVMLYRAVPSGYSKSRSGNGYDNYISSIGYATSRDGYNFTCYDKLVIYPDVKEDIYGCEDPRITRLTDNGKDTYLITYTALSSPAFSENGYRVALAVTDDFKTFTKHGVIIPGHNDKDAVFFPEKIKGKIILLHRIPPDIQIVYFDSLEQIINPEETFWKEYNFSIGKYAILKREFKWESEKIGAGPPPVKTEEGWLLIYHGVDENHVYRTGVVLLDLENPSCVISRSPFPILEPEADYEKYGDINNVVFPEGAIIIGDMLFVYYGAADKVCCLATVKIEELLDYLKAYRGDSW
ncbi:MAG: glycosidase [Planctomycetes bacterium]|nr:glycosidase [Planctomycetota bacterium]